MLVDQRLGYVIRILVTEGLEKGERLRQTTVRTKTRVKGKENIRSRSVDSSVVGIKPLRLER